MHDEISVLVLGASYGSLIAIKALAAGNRVTLVGRADEVAVIESEGITVEIPGGGSTPPFELVSAELPGRLHGCLPGDANPSAHDLVVLAMQEPHFHDQSVQALMRRVAESGKPCLSVMNMPPPPYLRRIPGLQGLRLDGCYTAPEAWDGIAQDRLTLCSPDPQAARLPDGPLNRLKVGLATNFRAAAFDGGGDTDLLRDFAAGLNDARVQRGARSSTMPVRLRVYESPFVPLSKWSMLMTGNYRCIEEDGMRSIRDTVLAEGDDSREIYAWVNRLLLRLGAAQEDLIPFEHYAKAARYLLKPSSAARALAAGATAIERVDRLVQHAARHVGIDSVPIDGIVARVDRRLAVNLRAAA